MADTKEVLAGLDTEHSDSKLLCIIANVRGAEEAVAFEKISNLGFPFSVSPTFQKRNANSTVPESLDRVKEIKRLCDMNDKELVVYISMAFGNPYDDNYSEEIVLEWIKILVDEGVKIISLSDTVGLAEPDQISSLVKKVISTYPDIETGVHLHSTRFHWKEKLIAALSNGCMRFDGALKGIGGCPMAKDELIGNMDSELMIPYFESLGYLRKLDNDALQKASQIASEIFV
ncbi:MAG: hydroxymethylglutaryl-CoA lyase [Ginsengibacter sp.]